MYTPGMERSEDEKDDFWDELVCEDRGKVIRIIDVNARLGDSEVVGKFGESGENENGRKLIELCTKKRQSIENTFKKKISISLHGQVKWMTVKVYWTSLWCRRRKEINFWT